MYVIDIVTIFFICALIMLPLGYKMNGYFPTWKNRISAYLLAPRYLKKQGVSLLSNAKRTEQTNE